MKPQLKLAQPFIPKTPNDKLAAAVEWLGSKHVLSADYKPKVRVGFYLTGWAKTARQRIMRPAKRTSTRPDNDCDD